MNHAQDVYMRATRVASDLEAEGKVDDAYAVLFGLSFYLAVCPAFPDGSCYKLTQSKLEKLKVKKKGA